VTGAEARKLDILLALKKKGYNLVDGDKPETMTMNLGGGYTLECNVKNPTTDWKIYFSDGIETTEYPADSEKVVYTHRKDSDKLIDEYNAGLGGIGIVETPAEAKPSISPAKHEESVTPRKTSIKNKTRAKAQEPPGMILPIVYPSEMKGNFMRFGQWTANNDVIPGDSEVVILEEDEYNFRVYIPQARISFDIPKDKAAVVEA
jgi:hypothetical protein